MANVLPEPTHRTVTLTGLAPAELHALSRAMKLALSQEDMLAVQSMFGEEGREPTDVELEVIAQTWSEHCKHRIFNARIAHQCDGAAETVDSLFKTYVKAVTERIMERKPGFVLSAFHDNAGFVKLDDEIAACLKVETHNHPSAIEPYAGANTGLGGVIRDILGAGKGAKPVASLDVFCFGPPDWKQEDMRAKDVIHPLGVMRGVVRGVRDYGNRMGIPTTSGAIQFHRDYVYNPLVFCGTMGVIPTKDIPKEVKPGHLIVAAGGRTGRDGLRGATFSSASLTTGSHEEDQSAVQIGNPIEEKKVADFVLAARAKGFIEFVTDCGAGGFSSAAGEMLSETGGDIFLENAPLKEPGLTSWEIFLSESQERMVLAVSESSMPELQALADLYETEMAILGRADGSGVLKVWHHGHQVCRLDCGKLHEAPRREMKGHWTNQRAAVSLPDTPPQGWAAFLQEILGDFAICSRHPVIREYDHEVQGNTMLKPLAGARGTGPQDGSVIRVDGSSRLLAMSLSLLPEWGRLDPWRMGAAVVDECVRQLVICGADPERLAILDNFCLGNPDNEEELGALVESVKGMAEVAEIYGAPFVSGKDSFYNYFVTDEGPVSIPVTLLVSGFGIVEEESHVTGSSLRRVGSALCLLGEVSSAMGGSVASRRFGVEGGEVPETHPARHLKDYRQLHEWIKAGVVLSAHDVSEGGLLTTLAEMAFSGRAGVALDVGAITTAAPCGLVAKFFAETPGLIVVEMDPTDAEKLNAVVIGHTIAEPIIRVSDGDSLVFEENVNPLYQTWLQGLTPYY